MTCYLKNDAVFLHIPKTGGGSVMKTLRKLDLVESTFVKEHADLDRVLWENRLQKDRRVIRGLIAQAFLRRRKHLDLSNTFKFCFVRKPLDWYVSYWRWMQFVDWPRQGDERDRYDWHPTAMLNGLGGNDFNEFVRNINRKRPGFVTEMYGWYTRPGVDFIGRQENLNEDLGRVLKQMNISYDPEKIAAEKRSHDVSGQVPKPEWDPALKKETLRLEYAGYVRFGYPVEE